MSEAAVPRVPDLPPGREVELPGRGTTFVRELAGPPGAPTLLLLHGWTVTADLNFFRCYFPLGEHYRVLALDHRGHGRGIRSRRVFRLEDCADDAAALLDVLGIDQAVAVGYSMGGPVAQLLWRRHRDRVSGLVLCSTSRNFASTLEERWSFLQLTGLATAARFAPAAARTWLSQQYMQRRSYEDWARQEVERHDWAAILSAGSAIGSFSSREWIGEVDVPAAVVITMEDAVVPVRRQLRLAEAIPGARTFRVHAPHDAAVTRPERFLPALLGACEVVTQADSSAGARQT
jgi:3-oxoadipate enol-lactonase